MNMIRQMMVVLALAGMSVTAPAWAQYSSNRDTGWEFGFDAVYWTGSDMGFEGGSELSTDDEIGVGLVFGYRFNSRLELQFALDWTVIDYDGTIRSANPIPLPPVRVSGELESFTPRVNGSYNFIDGPLTPYVTGGIGWAFIDTNIPEGRVEIGCWWDPWYGQVCVPVQDTRTTDAFTYQAGAGVRWDFSRGFTMKLAYEKHWYDLDHATSTPDLDQFKLGFVFVY